MNTLQVLCLMTPVGVPCGQLEVKFYLSQKKDLSNGGKVSKVISLFSSCNSDVCPVKPCLGNQMVRRGTCPTHCERVDSLFCLVFSL